MQDDLLNWLLVHYGQEQMRPGLSRMKEALRELLPAFKATKVVIIAGTNGKGETALRLSKLLENEPHFLWTSPHILRLTERFRSERGEIPGEELRSLIDQCHEEARAKKLELSFYEFLFFVFCTWASRHPPRYLLLEVGLGGRLDAVNVFDAELVLLPSISRDHQEILGNRYDLILREKLGTLREGSTLIHYLNLDYLRERAGEEATTVGAKVIDLGRSMEAPAYDFSLRNHQLASAAFSFLKGLPLTARSEVEREELEHRGEILRGVNEWLFFGSHNTDGMRKLIQFLHSGNYNFSRAPFDVIIVAFSNRDVRDVRVMMRMLKAGRLGKIVVTVFSHPKALPPQVAEDLSEEEGLEFVQDIASYSKGWKDQRVLVTGSYYFVGDFKKGLRR